MRFVLHIASVVLCGFLLPLSGFAQDFVPREVLVVDYDRMVRETRLAQTMVASVRQLKVEWQREAELVVQEFETEEQNLTELKKTLSPEDFAQLAEEFDAKVQSVREERRARAAQLNDLEREIPNVFRLRIRPIMTNLLQELKATVILDVNSNDIFDPAADVTNIAINRVDEAFLNSQSGKNGTQAQ